jgi:hypothetical protein
MTLTIRHLRETDIDRILVTAFATANSFKKQLQRLSLIVSTKQSLKTLHYPKSCGVGCITIVSQRITVFYQSLLFFLCTKMHYERLFLL